MRIVDLEPRRHVVDERDARELRLRLGHREHHDEAVVLLGVARVGVGPIERMEAALDGEAMLGGRLRRLGRAAHRNHRIERSVAAIGHRERCGGELILVEAAIERALLAGIVDA